jgi:hypothetical protein
MAVVMLNWLAGVPPRSSTIAGVVPFLAMTADGLAPAQAARKRQAATLQQALAAVVGNGRAPSHARPLPHIYGSAEYLQDAQARPHADRSPDNKCACIGLVLSRSIVQSGGTLVMSCH